MPDEPNSPEIESIDAMREDTFDFQEYRFEDYLTLGIFWLLAVDVFLQFFSRYVLGNSIAWTEEMARYLLIVVGFLGSSMAVRRNTHITVEFFYRYLSPAMSRLMTAIVDIARILFFAFATWITYDLAARTNSMMVSVDIPKSALYYIVLAGFALMLFRSIQVAIKHWHDRSSDAMHAEQDR